MLKRVLAAGLLLLVFVQINAEQDETIRRAWYLFAGNDPLKARDVFKEATGSGDVTVAAQGYRGLSAVHQFLGNHNDALVYAIEAYNQDRNIALLSSRPDLLIAMRSGNVSHSRQMVKLLKELAKTGGLFRGWYQDALLHYYLNIGNNKKAARICKEMGVLDSWRFIGPFENISSCGFSNTYPPERERDFSAEYTGKDGNVVRWHPLHNNTPRGWVFLDNFTTEYNSVYYFNCCIVSNDMQDALLSFGASGAFKIFLNGQIVLQDSVFRNTGTDAYMQKVHLNKGDNDLLIKIGHESTSALPGLSGKANFMIRLLDAQYNPLTGIQGTTAKASYREENISSSDLSPSPILDSITAMLNHALKSDSTDFDAFYSLATLYNMYEKTNEAQVLIQTWLKRYPSSSLLHLMVSESLMRAKKNTEYEVALKRAYDSCNLNAYAWNKQLQSQMSKGSARGVLEFLDRSPERFQKSPSALIAYLSVAMQQQNKSEVFKRIAELEELFLEAPEAVNLLSSIYVSQGFLQKAVKILQRHLAYNRQETDLYSTLADIAIKQGNVSRAVQYYLKAIKDNPSNPNAYYFMSLIYYSQKRFDMALQYIIACSEVIPASANVLNLKGNILASMGRHKEAIEAFKETVKYTSDDFVAWESIRTLSGKNSFEAMSPLPDVDSMIQVSADWVKKASSKAALVSYIEDVYYYPSRSSRSRVFLIMSLPNQQEIDTWKEYRIPFNSSYQLLSIDRAFSKKKDGSEVQADNELNYIVFKSLEPGDCIVLEYSLKDYYEGVMAGKVYGRQDFRLGLPSYDSRLRLITPQKDTIPYCIFGDSLKVRSEKSDDYVITTISSSPYISRPIESFCPSDHQSYTKAIYSNFHSWSEIANWYYELSRHKQNQTLELQALADSLFKGALSKRDKAVRIHEYITRNINYSYVPFRQSAWIPQSAKDVLATRIGDCKDMSSLGKCLMDMAAIESYLVLVNTTVRNFTNHSYIGPNFDHCILQYIIDADTVYADFTDKYTAPGGLPVSDQGAMALVIRPGNETLITLPLDSPQRRSVVRAVKMRLEEDGTLHSTIDALRTGIFGAGFRALYRFLSSEEQANNLQRVISDDYHTVSIDSLHLGDLDQLRDSVQYTYSFTAKNAAAISGTTIIFGLKLPDVMKSEVYPVEENRCMPVDMTFSVAGITEMTGSAELTYPESWSLMSIPEDVSLKTDYMQYSLRFKVRDKVITVERAFSAHYNQIFSHEEFSSEREALTRAAKADEIRILFTKR